MNKNARRNGSRSFLSLWLLCAVPICVQAITPQDDYSQDFINRRSNLSALGVELFGDETSLNTGITEFAADDIDLPGNNVLPVRLSRRFRVQKWVQLFGWKAPGIFGDWDLDVPYLHGTFAATSGNANSGWTVSTSGAPNARCSIDPANPSLANPPNAMGDGPVPSAFVSYEFWYGNELHVPRQGNHAMMVIALANTNRPNNGTTSRWVTDNQWVFSCLTSTANGVPGEAFLAMAPDGTKYWFDWFAKTTAEPLSVTTLNGQLQSTLSREDVYIFPSRMEDRFGNSVTYTFDPVNPMRLTSVQASDGRSIQLFYNANGYVDHATAGTQTWSYTYGGTVPFPTLTRATLPDSSHWDINFGGTLGDPGTPGWRNCADIGLAPGGSVTKTVTHPSGAVGTFVFAPNRLGRSNVPKQCKVAGGVTSPFESKYVDVVAITSKQISGPGISTPQSWSFDYGPINASWTTECTSSCPMTRVVTITQPDSSTEKFTFSNRFEFDEGKLLTLDILTASAQVLRSSSFVYETDPTGKPYPAILGTIPCYFCDHVGEKLIPRKTTTVSQQDATFSRVVNSFDSFAREATLTASSSLGSSRSEAFTYNDNFILWVLGQRATHSVNSIEADRTDYDTKAMPWKLYSFGLIQKTLTYETPAGTQAGTLKTVTDARGNITTLTNWKRGLPQLITFPATAETPAGATDSVVVNDNGWIDSRIDASGAQTCYAYDAMGRISGVTYPTESNSSPNVCSTTTWNALSRLFEQVSAPEFGLAAGHWRTTESVGNSRKIVYFDARWRPVLTRDYDVIDQAGTQRYQRFAYDYQNRKTFESYFGTTDSLTTGTTTAYDGLGRATSTVQDSEAGQLTTTIEYPTNFQVRITNPRNYITTTGFQAFDQPGYERPTSITLPEGAFIDIVRDAFGKTTSITRRNADNSALVTRSMVYDSSQQLCKSIEPETGATVFDYDAAGNLAWSAAGLNLPGMASCDRTVAQNSGRMVVRNYDSRNRISQLAFPDGNGTQSWGYTPDSLADTVTTTNAGASVTNHYDYYRRRMLKDETLAQPDVSTLSIAYGYDGNGHQSSVTYPGGSPVVSYAPNALGQATQAGSYAIGVNYFPNGGVHQFTYGNGIVHTETQNARQLPEHITDIGSTGVIDSTYTYDAIANVHQIVDAVSSAGSKLMTYDGLNRLLETDSTSFGSDGRLIYTYDAIDNVKTAMLLGVKQYNYGYEPSTNRLTSVTDNSGNSIYGFSYDAQGNLSSKNAQGFTFDYGNRLRTAETSGTVIESYRYDANGRRVMSAAAASGNIVSFYGKDGMLRYQADERTGKSTDYIYLGSRMVARVSNSISPGVPTLTTNPASFTPVGNYTVQWTSPATATSYELQESVGSGAFSTIFTGAAVSRSMVGKASGVYSYKVRACSGIGCGGYSAAVSITVAAPPSTAPSITVPSSVPNGSYSVVWTAVSDATSYTLQESANGGAFANVFSGSATSAGFSSKPAGTYTYQVQACNANGCGPVSSNGSAVVFYAPTSAPSVSAPSFSNNGSYVVSWSSVSGANNYRLEESANGGAFTEVANTAGTSTSLSGRSTGSYSYRARACNAAGCGPYSGVSSTQVTFPPSGAPSLSAPATPGPGTYTVNWTAVAAATSYALEESVNGGGYVQIQNSAAQSFGASGKSPGTYSYRVSACNAGGCGPSSSPATVTVLAPPATPVQTATFQPIGVVPPISTRFNISWTVVSGATSYESQSSVGGINYTGPGTSYQFTQSGGPLIGGVIPQFHVRACNAGGCSAYSPWITPSG